MAEIAVFLDRDGTMNKAVPYCRHPEDFQLFPGTGRAIRLLNERGYKVIVITNQSGVARGYFTENTLGLIHQEMRNQLAAENARVDAIYYCPHHPDDNCECRKPKPGLLRQAASEHGIDLTSSVMAGDKNTDVLAARAAGCVPVLIGPEPDEPQSEGPLWAPDLYRAVELIHTVLDGVPAASPEGLP